MARSFDKGLIEIQQKINHIEEDRKKCRELHDKHDESADRHHSDFAVHVSDPWREELRSRLDRIEALQNDVLARLMKKS